MVSKKKKPLTSPPPQNGGSDSRRVLVVGTEAGMRHSLQRLLQPAGYEVYTAGSDKEALTQVKETTFDLVLMDIHTSGIEGLATFTCIRELDPKLPIVLITAYGTAELAIQAMQTGAYDYVLKPFDVARLKETIKNAANTGRLNRTRVTIEHPHPIDPLEDRIVGINSKMLEIYKQIGQVAATNVPLLIRGETGTGKDLVARATHQHSKRADFPFLAINCSAIPDGLLESELFGHERGAFTGAFTRRIGKFEQADKGTIFLDEIGDMPLATQSKILRVLEGGTFQRVGGDEQVEVDVRIIAATHQDLEADVREELFREDLYYRLNVVSVALPPLRDRKDDLPRLIDYFMSRFCDELNVEQTTVSSEALEKLIRYDWPGNVRELQNCLKNAILTGRGGGPISAEDVHLPLAPRPVSGTQKDSPPDSSRTHKENAAHPPETPQRSPGKELFLSGLDDAWLNTLDENLHAIVTGEMERRLIFYALHRCDNNQVHAAELLGISRSMLRARLKRYERVSEHKENP